MGADPTAAVVIVGGGQAGVDAAFGLRLAGHSGPVTLLSADPDEPYRRPQLSKEVIAPDGTDVAPLREASTYVVKSIGLRAGVRATGIDRQTGVVMLDEGGSMPYDRLLLATGSVPRRLPFADPDVRGVHYLRTSRDAVGLRASLARAQHVVVVGGGFIGLEVASAARCHGAAVTVVELGERLIGRAVSAPLSEYTLDGHRAQGTRVLLGDSVEGVESAGGGVTGVVTRSGQRIPADLLVVGVGVVPETTLAESAGLATDDGILVDEYLRTSDEHVYAIGDCARFPTRFAPAPVRLESIQNASDQARYVARQIAGGADEPYDRVPWFWSDQGSLQMKMAGLAAGHDRTEIIGDPEQGSFSVLCFAGGRLTGVESVGDPKVHMAARKVLARTEPVTYEELEAADLDLRACLTSRQST